MYRKEILITGGNAGIGFETAKALAKRGHRLTLLVRNKENGDEAVKLIKEQTNNTFVDCIEADLSSFSSIRSAAEIINNKLHCIDVLIHNAGTFYSNRTVNDAGIERTFMVNHLAIFYLTHLLFPLLSRSSESRIINVNSDSHFQASFDPGNLQLDRGYHGLKAYARSKLANVLFTYEFQRQNPRRNISVFALHPGLVNTGIGEKHTSFFHRLIWKIRSRSGKSPEEGAVTSIFLASENRENITSGVYWDNCKIKKSSKASYDKENAQKLWEASTTLCGIEDYFTVNSDGEAEK